MFSCFVLNAQYTSRYFVLPILSVDSLIDDRIFETRILFLVRFDRNATQ